MKTYLVGYDLNKPIQNYNNLIAAIKTYPNWWHHLDSTWIVKTDREAMDIVNHLKTHIDSSDELLVVRLSGEWAAIGFDAEGTKWLYDYMSYT